MDGSFTTGKPYFRLTTGLNEKESESFLSETCLLILVHTIFLTTYLSLVMVGLTFSGTYVMSWYTCLIPFLIGVICFNIASFAEFYYPLRLATEHKCVYISLTIHFITQAILLVATILLVAWTLTKKPQPSLWISSGCFITWLASWIIVLCCTA